MVSLFVCLFRMMMRQSKRNRQNVVLCLLPKHCLYLFDLKETFIFNERMYEFVLVSDVAQYNKRTKKITLKLARIFVAYTKFVKHGQQKLFS